MEKPIVGYQTLNISSSNFTGEKLIHLSKDGVRTFCGKAVYKGWPQIENLDLSTQEGFCRSCYRTYRSNLTVSELLGNQWSTTGTVDLWSTFRMERRSRGLKDLRYTFMPSSTAKPGKLSREQLREIRKRFEERNGNGS